MDVVVAGVGVAGSFTLHYLPKNFEVVGIDKRTKLGYPVECGEIVPVKKEMKDLLPNLDDYSIFEIPKKFESNRTKWMKFILPNGREIDVEFEMHVIKRDEMIRTLAENSGHKLILGKMFDFDGDVVVDGKKIESKVIIGCDGANSRIRRRLGLKFEISPAKQYVVRGFEGEEDTIYMYVGRKIAAGGYAWIIPKGEGLANVGTGFRVEYAERGDNIHKALDRFLREYPYSSWMLKKAEIIQKIGAVVPIDLPVKSVHGKVILAGDSASMIISHVGAGIPPSMVAGKIAAEVVTEFLNGRVELEEYERRWKNAMYDVMVRSNYLKRMWDKIAERDERVNKLFRIVSEKDMGAILRAKIPVKIRLASFLLPIITTFL